MKFKLVSRLLDESLLFEDIEAVKKNFPKIPDDKFMQLIALDPTYNKERNSVGTYGKWILNLFNKGKLDNEGHVKDALTRFEDNKKYLINKDINSFKSLDDLDTYLNDESSYKEKTHAQAVRDRQKDRKNADLNTEATKVFSGDGFDVWIPHTYAASCKLGQGTSWCTASTEDDYYYNSYKHNYGGEYYILIDKNNPTEKYQFHFESGQFMDADDCPIKLPEFLNSCPALFDYFMPNIERMIGIDSYSFEEEIEFEFSDSSEIKHLDNLVEDMIGFDPDRVTISDCVSILLDPVDYFEGNDFYYSYYDVRRYIDADINEDIENILIKLGANANTLKENYWLQAVEELEKTNKSLALDIEDSIAFAYSKAQHFGKIQDAQNCVTTWLEDCNAHITDYECLVFKFKKGDILDLYFNNFWKIEPFFSPTEDIDSILWTAAKVSKEFFNVRIPYYDLSGFDEEVFIDSLRDKLNELL